MFSLYDTYVWQTDDNNDHDRHINQSKLPCFQRIMSINCRHLHQKCAGKLLMYQLLYGHLFVSLKAGWTHLYYTPPSQESATKCSVCTKPDAAHSHHTGPLFPHYVRLNECYLIEAFWVNYQYYKMAQTAWIK